MRIVKTLKLVDSSEAIEEYKRAHREIWPEIRDGIKSVGISAMDIYLLGNLAVMVMEYPDNLDIDNAMKRLATLPRQQEWEEYVARFQQCLPGDTSAEKWKEMPCVFNL